MLTNKARKFSLVGKACFLETALFGKFGKQILDLRRRRAELLDDFGFAQFLALAPRREVSANPRHQKEAELSWRFHRQY